MVEVAHAVPAFALIVVRREAIAVVVGPCQRLSAIIVADDVGTLHLIGHTLVGLGREIHPVGKILAVIDHHIGNDARTFLLVGIDHGTQLFLGTERRVLVEIIQWIIAHRGAASGKSRLRYPKEREIVGDFFGLRFKFAPLGGRIGIPIEPLQHHALIVGGPTLGVGSSQSRGCKNQRSKDFFHCLFD